MVEATLTRSMPACSHGGRRSRDRSVIRCANSFTISISRNAGSGNVSGLALPVRLISRVWRNQPIAIQQQMKLAKLNKTRKTMWLPGNSISGGSVLGSGLAARTPHPQLANRTRLVELQVQIECGFFCLLTLCFYYC